MAGMSISAATLLSQTQTAISNLLVALANVNIQEYWTADGRKISRADFPKTLLALEQLEQIYLRRAATEAGNRPRFLVGRIGRVTRSGGPSQ